MTDSTKTIAFLATDGYEDSELTSPWDAVKDAGFEPTLIPVESGSIEGKKGHQADVDLVVAEAGADSYAGLVLPGGVVNADHLRMDEDAVAFVKSFFNAKKPVAVICHGAWILADADVLSGRTITSYPSLKTDLKNAGATWVDEEVCVDGALVSSRTPDDLPAFNEAFVKQLTQG